MQAQKLDHSLVRLALLRHRLYPGFVLPFTNLLNPIFFGSSLYPHMNLQDSSFFSKRISSSNFSMPTANGG